MEEKQSSGGLKVSTTKIIPCVFTLANLLLGALSLIIIIEPFGEKQHYALAAVLVLLAMVLDGMDGRLARRFDATSAFGKELDSLADLVSFGVAPALLAYAYQLKNLGSIGLVITVAFILCGAIRLARFNVLNISKYFVGVPITAAGSFIALIVLLATVLKGRVPAITLPIVVTLLAFLMVSQIKVPKY